MFSRKIARTFSNQISTKNFQNDFKTTGRKKELPKFDLLVIILVINNKKPPIKIRLYGRRQREAAIGGFKMGLSPLKRFFRRNIEAFICRSIFILSMFLRRLSYQKWQRTVSALGGSEGQGKGELEKVGEGQNFEKHPETPATQATWADASQQSAAIFLLPEWAKEIQTFLQNQLSDHTRRAYESDLKQFLRFFSLQIPSADIHSLRPEHVVAYRKCLEQGRITGKPLQQSTINRKLAVIKSFLNWLKVNQIIRDNPAELVKGYPQTQESSLKGLSDEEAKKILEMPVLSSRAGALHSAVLHCLFYLGLRKGELIQLKVGDLDEERGVAVMKVRGKGHRVRILPMTPVVRASIEHYFKACRRNMDDKEAPLFMPTKNPRGTTLKTLNPNAITYIVKRYATKAGVLKQISPHSCRATCISNALDRKATHRSVQHLAGWSTPLMIQRYDKRREDLKNSAAFLIDYGEEIPTKISWTCILKWPLFRIGYNIRNIHR